MTLFFDGQLEGLFEFQYEQRLLKRGLMKGTQLLQSSFLYSPS